MYNHVHKVLNAFTDYNNNNKHGISTWGLIVYTIVLLIPTFLRSYVLLRSFSRATMWLL